MTAFNSQLIMEDICFERNYQTLFSGITVTVNPGELLQVMGANGSGKSTLLRIIAGFLEPESGHIIWQNHFINKDREAYLQHVQYLGHRNAIKPLLTVKENIELYAALNFIKVCNIENILQTVGLYAQKNKIATELSQGQSRRLALTRLMIKPASIWVLDEPNAALDEQGQLLLNTLYKNHLSNNGLIITATHQPIPLASKTCRPGSATTIKAEPCHV